MYKIGKLFAASILHLVALSSCSDDVFVTVECGHIKGNTAYTAHGTVYEFHQIPYAEPPIGHLRWTHSKLLSGQNRWFEAYDATGRTRSANPIKCVQAWNGESVVGVEDCLYLTVRTPDLQPIEGLPVLVWIHGGSLKTGWSDYPGYAPDTNFAGDLRVVTVNINYRLDVFGFFSSPDIWNGSDNYGNFGIGDALTALEWVNKNIIKFGGDPDNVTILGESSGGTIVLGLLGSARADGLFHKAISLSGPPIWEATPQIAHSRRIEFAEKIGCTQKTAVERRECLKNATVLDLVKSRDLRRGDGFYDFPYSQGAVNESMDYNVIDHVIVHDAPFDLKKQIRRHKVKVFIGNTAQETGTKAIDYDANKVYYWNEAEDLLKEKLDKLSEERKDLKFKFDKHFVRKVCEKYNFERDSKDWWPQIFFDTLTTDLRTTCINNDLVEELNKNRYIEAYRLYIKNRPDEIKCGTPWSCIHAWDTEALFDYKYYGPYMLPQTIADRHQRMFKDNIRELVSSICYDRDIEGWTTKTSLTMENDDFPSPITLDKHPPQSSQCKFWKKEKMLQFGWQN